MSADASILAPEPWLEVVEGASPILLIAPHGGRAGEAAHSTLHPKVNDLHTADITRELAERLDASALINSAMDRNLIDCNRIPQLAKRAPWLLEIIADRLAAIIDRFGHATVLLVHGWNIIEPRIDLGLGVRRHGHELRPVGAAHVSATDEFIHGPLDALATRLRDAGIAATFGMRYPAGGIHNLVQAFTERHRESDISPLGRISAISAKGLVNTAQLELSVSVRLPGVLRDRCIAAIVDTFSPEPRLAPPNPPLSVIRTPRPAVRRTAPAAPLRVGVEFYDAASRVGAMASFDLGTPGFGARIMMIVGERRVILCTCEGTTKRDSDRLSLGPLSLSLHGDSLALDYNGPAVVVPDGSTYLSIERALATGILDPSARVSLRMPLAGAFDPAVLFSDSASTPSRNTAPLFSLASGEATLEGRTHSLRASTRAGVSFTGLGSQTFSERRMLWAMFDDTDGDLDAVELRRIDGGEGSRHESVRIFSGGDSYTPALETLEIETLGAEMPPHRLEAATSLDDGDRLHLVGSSAAFVPLSRPGPNGSRIYTSLGFGTFTSRNGPASGMFEYSRRVEPAAPDDNDNEGDSD